MIATPTAISDVTDPSAASALPAGSLTSRPDVRGKFLYADGKKLYLRGITYGPFRPEADGCEYRTQDVVERDFQLMAECGFNAVRLYTVPPRWLLDVAGRCGLRVLVGLPWEQHVAFLDDGQRMLDIERRVREGARACAGHPALLALAIGNEISSSLVRWYGRRRIERFLKRLYTAVKAEDSGALVTYVNYPSTEYLQLPFLDFVCFNVYLESVEKLESYLARLHNVAGERPLILGEVGLDSIRNGEAAQARTLEWQIPTAFRGGCGGLFLFAWTDEWHRGGHDVEDWAFGLTSRDRLPKPALDVVRRAFANVPFDADREWPRVSVVVCTYNGKRTIRDCLEGLRQLEYPCFEVIVVDDGSTDGVGEIVRQYPVRVIRTANRGLSNARNTGLLAATGSIVAFIDDDARPDPHWLHYLADTFAHSRHAAVGGPNIAPPGDGFVADCVAHAPGGPVHVLLTDSIAEHVPGCNMAFRRTALLEIGGFDPRFRIAGDDVDVCWRVQERGWTIGFNPAAVVWHHRRNSARAYLWQQLNYGRAEAVLERKWPAKYNALGHAAWAGRVYGKGLLLPLALRPWRIYHGTWGSALFQSVYHTAPGTLTALPTTPEWYLIVLSLGALSLASLFWPGLKLALPLFVATGLISLVQSFLCGVRAASANLAPAPSPPSRRRTALIIWLHLLQPCARLLGRFSRGLTPLRFRRAAPLGAPYPRSIAVWSEQPRSLSDRLISVESALRERHALTLRGGNFDHWDLEVVGGLIGGARLKVTVEEHGGGKQMVRLRAWPTCRPTGACAAAASVLLGAASLASPAAEFSGALFFVAAALLTLVILRECSIAIGAVLAVLADAETDSVAQA